jgi:hypothetical protein
MSMTDHTIEVHFTDSSISNTSGNDREKRIIVAMAKALGGENAGHPLVIFEATKIYKAVEAMREAMAKEDN